MMDILAFIGGFAILFAAGAVAYMAIRGVWQGIKANTVRHYWFYYPLAILCTIITCRAAMFCLDLINIYFISTILVFD